MTNNEINTLLLVSEQLCIAVRKYKNESKISLNTLHENSDFQNAISGYYTYPRTYSSYLLWLLNSSIYIFTRVNGDMLRMLDELCACIPLYINMNTYKYKEFKDFKKRWNNIVHKIKPLLSTREIEDFEIIRLKNAYMTLELIENQNSIKYHTINKKEQKCVVKLRHQISSDEHQEGHMMETGMITSKTIFFKHYDIWWSFESKNELLVFLKSSIDNMKNNNLHIMQHLHNDTLLIDTKLCIENIKIGYSLHLLHAKRSLWLKMNIEHLIWKLLLVVENRPKNTFLFPYIGILFMEYMLYIYKKIDELLDVPFIIGTPKRACCDCGTHTYFICKEENGFVGVQDQNPCLVIWFNPKIALIVVPGGSVGINSKLI